MFVESFKNNGIPYLRLVRNDRITNKNGVKTSTKRVVLPEFATSSHNNIKLFLYFSRFSLIFLCPYDIMCM